MASPFTQGRVLPAPGISKARIPCVVNGSSSIACAIPYASALPPSVKAAPVHIRVFEGPCLYGKVSGLALPAKKNIAPEKAGVKRGPSGKGKGIRKGL